MNNGAMVEVVAKMTVGMLLLPLLLLLVLVI